MRVGSFLMAGLLMTAVLAGVSVPTQAAPPPGVYPDYDCVLTPFNRAWTSVPTDGCPWADQGAIDLGTTVTFNTDQIGSSKYDDERWFRIVGPGASSTFDGCTSDGDDDDHLWWPWPNWGYEQLGGLSINFLWQPPLPGLYHAV